MAKSKTPYPPIPLLKEYIAALPTQKAKEDFASRCGTSLPYLRLCAGGFKQGNAALAISLDRETKGFVPCELVNAEIDFAYLRGKKRRAPAIGAGAGR